MWKITNKYEEQLIIDEPVSEGSSTVQNHAINPGASVYVALLGPGAEVLKKREHVDCLEVPKAMYDKIMADLRRPSELRVIRHAKIKNAKAVVKAPAKEVKKVAKDTKPSDKKA